MFIIIPKPNKPSYNTLNRFHSIILLNMLGKLIKKVISSRFQTYIIVSNFIHASQLGNIKQHLTTDTSIFLIYLIHTEWIKSFHTSTLIFDIVHFFPFLNYCLLSMILTNVGFDSNISLFFSNYLIKRQTQYV